MYVSVHCAVLPQRSVTVHICVFVPVPEATTFVGVTLTTPQLSDTLVGGSTDCPTQNTRPVGQRIVGGVVSMVE
jgi:hypothetical protein